MDLRPLMKNKWLLLLGILGVFCLVFGSFWNGSGKSLPTLAPATTGMAGVTNDNGVATASPVTDALTLENAYEKKLDQMLLNIQGIHAVRVMVMLDATDQVSLAESVRKTTQETLNGPSKTQSTTTDSQIFTESRGGDQVPVVVQSTAPKVRGVLVTVNAEDFYVAKAEIIDAITNVLDVPAYKISVEPEKNIS